jgi:predicted DNA binding CopG/RHH family protein
MNKKDVKKDKKLTIRLTANEVENIKKQAEKNGYKSVSKFVIDKSTKID